MSSHTQSQRTSPGNFSLSPKDAWNLNINDAFNQELIELWADLNYKDSFTSQADFSAGYIWNNSLIRIAGKSIVYKQCVDAGLLKINDLMTSDLRFITYSSFKDKFCLPVSFLEFCGATSAIVTLHGKTGTKVIARSQHASTSKQKNLILARLRRVQNLASLLNLLFHRTR